MLNIGTKYKYRKEKKKTKVLIDAGHGGKDSGAVFGNLKEKDITLEIAKEIIKKSPNNIKLTRSFDKTLLLEKRIEICRKESPDCFVSIHINADNKNAGEGFESYIAKSHQKKTEVLQVLLHKEILKINSKFGIKDRGQKRANFYVLTKTRCPAVLLELYFMKEHLVLKDTNYKTLLAAAIINAVNKL